MEGGKRKCLAIAAMVLAALNHHVVLQKTNTPGIGICPVSGYRFAYAADEADRTKKVAITTSGKMVETEDWGIKSIDGDGG